MALQNIPSSAFAVIVVCDGPDHETAVLLNQCGLRQQLNLRLLQAPVKGGPAAARNIGWRVAQTPLIAFTDDDCLPQPSWLDAFTTGYAGEELMAYSGKTIVPMPDKNTDFALNLKQLEYGAFITANCACTYKALLKVNGFDERFKMAWREDSDLEFKLISQQIPIRKIGEAEVVHPVRTVPWGISVKEQKKGLYDALLYKKFPELFKAKSYAPIWNYYSITLLTLLLFIGIYLNLTFLIAVSACGLLYLLAQFIARRLNNRHKSWPQVVEIASTSLVIPFISVFWRLYGSIKYRVFFF
ncbi:glycosyltransferase [Pedobacter sp.]|uniref:glycosyltransferase n=1 Tax=Pedobacter sp. TaxID=1411316 RepID=UPI003D7F3794